MKMKFLLLVVVVLILLPGACSPRSKVKESDPEKIRAKWEAEVRKIIKDPRRAEKVIDLGVKVEMKNPTLYEEIDRLNQELMDVNQNYDSTREYFNQLFSEVQGKRKASTAKVLDRLPDLKRFKSS